MSFVNGKFYMNPAYGRAVERARDAALASNHNSSDAQSEDTRWVTINGRHVLIQEARASQRHRGAKRAPGELSARDKAYLDKYYEAVKAMAEEYKVDPALVLAVGVESGFATQGTYLRTGDAFGITGGSTKHMTTASSPEENSKQFFDNYGKQIRGTGSDDSAFLNALQGRDALGDRVPGWKVYNTDKPDDWRALMQGGISEMRRAVPIYQSQRTKEHAP